MNFFEYNNCIAITNKPLNKFLYIRRLPEQLLETPEY